MADDAKLLAVIEANTRQFENALKRIEGQTDRTFARADRSVRRLDNSFKASAASAARFGRSLGIAFTGATAIALAARTIRAFIDNTIESEAAVAQLNAVLRSTGGAAGLSSDALQDLAKQLQSVSIFGDEAIIGAENLLLTFTKIGKDVFPSAIAAVLNMSTALGTDLNSSARVVGKALQDPVKALGALRKVGVGFTADQEAIIKSLVKTGDLAGAQAIILDKLKTKYGESAKAARDTLGGALKALSEAWGDLFEVSGPASDQLRQGIEDIIKAISDPKFKEGVEIIGVGLVGALARMVEVLLQLSSAVDAVANSKLGKLIADLMALQEFLSRFAPALNPLGALVPAVEALNKVATVSLGPVESKVVEAEALGKRLAAAFDVAEHPETGDFEGRGFGFAGPDPDALDEAADAEAELAAQIEREAEAQRKAEQAREQAAEALDREKEAVKQLISDLEFENSLIGLSNEQREKEIVLRRAGAAATEPQREAIERLVAAGFAEQQSLDDLIDRMDEIRNAAGGALSAFNDALRNGEGLAGSLKSALESVLDTVIRIAEQRAIESLFGAFGTAGGGGGIGAIIGGLFGGATTAATVPTGTFAAQTGATVANMTTAGTAGGQPPTVVQLVVGPGQLFEPTVVGISGAVAVQTVTQNNRAIPAMIANSRARGTG